MSGLRLVHESSHWREWYRRLLIDMADLTPADVLARWIEMAAPSYSPAGPAPTAEQRAAAGEHGYIERGGIWWVRDPMNDDAGGRPAISWDGIGPYLRSSDGRILRDRKQAARALGGLANEPMVAILLGHFLTGRQDGSRRTKSREAIAKALLVLGLVDVGMSVRGGVQQWLEWECEFDGALADPGHLALIQSPTADLADKQASRTYLDSEASSVRRTWKELGLKRLDESAST